MNEKLYKVQINIMNREGKVILESERGYPTLDEFRNIDASHFINDLVNFAENNEKTDVPF